MWLAGGTLVLPMLTAWILLGFLVVVVSPTIMRAPLIVLFFDVPQVLIVLVIAWRGIRLCIEYHSS